MQKLSRRARSSGHRAKWRGALGALVVARVALVVAHPATPAQAQTAHIPAQRDNTLIESATGALSNGAGPVIFAGRTTQALDSRRRAVLVFDVASSLPAGVVVTDVALYLDLSPSNPHPVAVQMHRLLADWGEGESAAAGGSGAPATPGDATWIHTFYDDHFWADAGGDFAPAASAATQVGEAGVYRWSSPQMVADVQIWLDDPAGNFGWILIGDEATPSTSKRFYSREADDPGMRPELVVSFLPPCEIPELPDASRGLCIAYCEALDCDGFAPNASPRACDRLAREFARRSDGAAPPCERPAVHSEAR
jgi:hypothetical protein